MDLFEFDATYRRKGYPVIAGIDEAGRGPWAGPVVAAAVILPPDAVLPGLDDSKKLTPLKRERLFDSITATALGIGVGIADHATIDAVNILVATHQAMKEALAKLPSPPRLALVDGLAVPTLGLPHAPVVGGDAKSASIAAASVIAKVTRDRLMDELAREYPDYGFARHKGYGTPDHLAALKRHGPCPIHRRTFAPVRKCIEGR